MMEMPRGKRVSALFAFWKRVLRPTVVAPLRRDDEIAEEDPWGRHGSCSEPRDCDYGVPPRQLGRW